MNNKHLPRFRIVNGQWVISKLPPNPPKYQMLARAKVAIWLLLLESYNQALFKQRWNTMRKMGLSNTYYGKFGKQPTPYDSQYFYKNFDKVQTKD